MIRLAAARTLTAAILLAGACTSVEPSPAPAASPPTGASAAATPAAPEPSPSPSAEPAPNGVEVGAPPGGSLLVHGRYPPTGSSCVRPVLPRLDARYPGTVSIEPTEDGTLSLTLAIGFQQYLEGIAEVPPSWPRAALEAQAIAARSYALATTGWSGEAGDALGTPICATAACQVYRGIPLTRSPETRRWYRAVRATAGEVLLHEGRPAETVYFSTSNGRTYGNEDVFGSGALPYLRPVVERDDDASPLSRWRVRLRFADLAGFLARAGEWPADVPMADVAIEGDVIRVEGGGRTSSMPLSTFRDAVNAWAPCLEPARYPGRLPTTIPSRWLRLSSGPNAATISGRGWGHGAGMVQWGAYGKARRGLSAEAILAFYYGGLRPKPYPEPGLIRVEVASGLTGVRLVPSGRGATVNGEAVGRGRIVVAGGERLTVRTPAPG